MPERKYLQNISNRVDGFSATFSAALTIGLFTVSLLAGLPGAGSLYAQPGQSPQAELPGQAKEATLVVRGRLINGTRKQPTRVEQLALIAPGPQGMQSLAVLQNAGPGFQFPAIVPPQGPLLVRATYQGMTHTHVIPPVAARQNAPQDVLVYDGGATAADIGIYQGLKVIKKKDHLQVTRVFLVRNSSQPLRNFALDDYINLQLPANARGMQGRLQYRSTRMPINLNLQPGSRPNSLRLNRILRPESAEITITYEIPGHHLRVRPAIFLKPEESQGAGWSSRMVVLWTPGEAKPAVEQARTSLPEGMPAEQNHGDMLQLDFDPDRPAKLDFSAGPYAYSNLREGASNPIFNKNWVTVLGILFVLSLSLALIAGVRLSGLRLVQRDRDLSA